MNGQPGELDRAVHAAVLEVFALLGREIVDITQMWSDDAGMRFTEVQPRAEGPAPLSVSAQDADTLHITVGNISFEVFGDVRVNLPYLREIVQAAAAGDVEEAGPRSQSYGRIDTRSGTVHVGAVHLPAPWRRRRARRYRPFGDNSG